MKYYINAFPAESRAHRFGTACLLNRMPRKKAVRTGFQGLIDQPARLPPAALGIPRDCLSVPAWVIPEPDPTRRQRPEREMKESGENGRKKAEGREREKLSTPRGPEARPPGAPPGSDKSPRSCPSPWARGSRLPAQMLGFPSFPNPPPPCTGSSLCPRPSKCRGPLYSSKETSFPQPTPLQPALAPQSRPTNTELKRIPVRARSIPGS